MKKNKKLILCFDIDNVICKTEKNKNYLLSKPILKNINCINNLFNKGYHIKLFTARYMGRSKENIRLAKKKSKNLTITQLKRWNVLYHELIFGKPSYDLFIDDKSIFYKKNWSKKIENEIKKIQPNL